MRIGPIQRPGAGSRAVPVVLLVFVLLASTLMLPLATGPGRSPGLPTGSVPTAITLNKVDSVGRAAVTSGAAAIPTSLSLTAGSVVRTVFPGFNTSLPGSFTSSVSAWQVGNPAFVPSTNTVWFPQRSVSVPGIPAPTVSPAAVFNLTSGGFDQLVTNVSNASAFVYDPGNGNLYATDPTANSVLVVNPRTESVVGSPIPVGSDPTAIAFDPPSNNVFIANSGSANVTVISALDDRVLVANVAVGIDPVALVDDPQDALVFVANAGTYAISVITAEDPSSLGSIPLAFGPATGLSYSPRTDTVVATVASTNFAAVLEASTQAIIVQDIPVGKGVTAAATSANGTEFILGNATGGDVVVLNSTYGTPVIAKIPVDRNATQLILDPQTGSVYCWTSSSRILESINLSSETAATVAPTTLPQLNSISSFSAASRVYISSGNDSLTFGLDPLRLDQVTRSISTPYPSVSIAVDSSNGRFYVGTTGDVEVYNSTSDLLIGAVAGLSGESSQLVLDSPDNLLWLMNSISGVSAVNLTSNSVALTTGISVYPRSNEGVAVDIPRSAVFVLNAPGTVRVLNSTNGEVLVPSVAIGSNVTSIAYDSANNQLYAAGDGVSLVNGSSFKVDAGPIVLGGSHRVLDEVYEPSRKAVYIASVGLLSGEQGAITVLDGSSIAASEGSAVEIPVGESPVAFGIVTPGNTSLPGSAMVWVANELSGTVSVISSPPEITSFSSSPSTIDLGFPTAILVTYQGGAGESNVSYRGLPSGCSSASKLMLNCTPNVSGTFTLAVNVTDSFGFSANAMTTLVVERSLAVRTSFSLSTFPNIDPGIPLRGTAAASDGLPPYTFSWSFSDGTGTSGPNASHTYLHPGIYLVTVEVRDSTGATNSSSTTVVVVSPPSAAVSVSPGNVTDVNIPLTFAGTVSGGTGTVQQNWTFGDGGSSVSPNTTHAWTRPGNYTIGYYSIDALGVGASRSLEVNVNPSLTATFSSKGGSVSDPAAPASPISFTSNASGGTRPYSVTWSFGDGSFSFGVSANHSYASPGTYSVEAKLTDTVGAGVTTNLTVVVAQNSSSSAGLSSLSGEFGSGLFLGLVAGGVLAAVVLFAVGLRKGARPPSGPVSPYVPP
jgi:YVTN family beta-propeller protein